MERVRRLKEVGEEYESLLNDVLNLLFKVVPNCVALNMDDSLYPIYAVTSTKTSGLLAFPYKCEGKTGYIILKENGEVIFEDYEGNVKKMGEIK